MSRVTPFRFSHSFASESLDNPNSVSDGTMVIHHCNVLIEYLEKNHGIRVPNDYALSVSQANVKHRKSTFSISTKTIDSIISCCQMWKEFIDVDDYDKLVCEQIISMISIHSSVISARNFQEQYGITFKKQPSKTFVTIVNNSGSIKVYP